MEKRFREFVAETFLGIEDSRGAYTFLREISMVSLSNENIGRSILGVLDPESNGNMFVIDTFEKGAQKFLTALADARDGPHRLQITQDAAVHVWNGQIYVVPSGGGWIFMKTGVPEAPESDWGKIREECARTTEKAVEERGATEETDGDDE